MGSDRCLESRRCVRLCPIWGFIQAGAELADDADLTLAGVDCTLPTATKLCQKYDVKGYPTIKLFESGYSKKNNAKVQYNTNATSTSIWPVFRRSLPPPLSPQRRAARSASHRSLC